MQGKVVIVTGGANGIGKDIANSFFKLGAITIVIDKEDNKGTNCSYFYKGDLTLEEVIIDFIKNVLERYNKVDYLINNAGLSKGGLDDCSYEDFLYVQKLSLAAPFLLVKLLKDNFNKGLEATK